MATSPLSRRGDLLDPEVLAALGPLDLLARRVVSGFLLGMHRSARHGLSGEFAELRPYRPGDDLRQVDWRMVGRSDRFFVKQFDEDTHLGAYLLLDVSASMEWSSRPDDLPTKLWYGRLLTAAFGLLLFRQGDRVGFGPFDEEVREWLPARGGGRHESRFLRRVAEVEAGGRSGASLPLRESALRLRRAGMVILVSDLLMDPGETASALRYLAHRGHQVIAVHLLDPGERELEGSGLRRFRDPETGDEVRVEVRAVREAYRRSVTEAVEEWRRALVPSGIDYLQVDTSEPFAPALRALLRSRSRR
jgi:uncharacterized protein (DUF58 family)